MYIKYVFMSVEDNFLTLVFFFFSELFNHEKYFFYNAHLFRKGRGHDWHGAKPEEVDQRQRAERHVLFKGEPEIPADALVVVPFAVAAAAASHAAHVERHGAPRNAAQFAERVPFHRQRHATGVMELFRIVDAEFLDAAAAAGAASALDAIAEPVGRGDLGRFLIEIRRLLVTNQAAPYVLVVVRASVLFIHTHAQRGDVVVRFHTTW